jgi:hypothetical protein
MPLTAASLATPMIAAVKGVLTQQWPQVKDYTEAEVKKLATSLIQITKLRVTGQITESECSVLLEMQKNTARAVMLAVQGMALLLVEQAINAALAAVRGIINTAIGFVLL